MPNQPPGGLSVLLHRADRRPALSEQLGRVAGLVMALGASEVVGKTGDLESAGSTVYCGNRIPLSLTKQPKQPKQPRSLKTVYILKSHTV